MTQSKKKKNSEVYPNNVSFEGDRNNIVEKSVYGITGYSAAGVNDGTNNATGKQIGETIGSSTVWYKEAGYEASTTGNITGVYDIKGGSLEYTANVIQTGNISIEKYGNEILNIKESNKYITLYPIGNSTKEETDIGRSYSAWGSMYGDGIWEVIIKEQLNNDNMGTEPFFIRGGSWNTNNGSLYLGSGDTSGIDSYDYTFRTVLIV